MPRPIPILFIGDSPDQLSGLGRIGRDLAVHVARLPEYRVGYLGLGARGTRQLPFPVYPIDQRYSYWGERELRRVWTDFAGSETGVVMTVWDISRCTWLGRPDLRPELLREWLNQGHFDLWGYFPVDSTGPQGRLTGISLDTLRSYARTVVPSLWAQSQVEGAEWLPHGLNLQVFTPQPKVESREWLSPLLHQDDFVVGVVASNQPRKDWGLVATATAALAERIPGLRAWWHIDVEERYWSIPALVRDYGLANKVLVTTKEMSDRELARAYSACDVTLHPGLGEGFCYPVAESLACGVPAIVGDYAAAPELVPVKEWKVTPSGFRLESLYNCLRPVYRPEGFVEAVERVREMADEHTQRTCVESVAHLGWGQLWTAAWRKWFVRGLERFR